MAEAAAALRAGAREIDMVINVGALRSGDFDTVRVDIQAVVRVCHDAGAIVKVILETALLDDAQKTTACGLAQAAGADFVKTSTGFGPAGATVQDIVLMRHAVGPRMGVKAAGGIRTLDDFRAMVAAGANRVGASASVKIVEAAAAWAQPHNDCYASAAQSGVVSASDPNCSISCWKCPRSRPRRWIWTSCWPMSPRSSSA